MGTSSRVVGTELSPLHGQITPAPTTVLVVDDSAFDRQLIQQLLEPLSELKLLFAADGDEALGLVEKETPAIVLTDLIMPGMEGLELVQRLRAEHPLISVILVTAFGSEEIAMQSAASRRGELHSQGKTRSRLASDNPPDCIDRHHDTRPPADPPVHGAPRIGLRARKRS